MTVQVLINLMPVLLCFSIPGIGGLHLLLPLILTIAAIALCVYTVPSVIYCLLLLSASCSKPKNQVVPDSTLVCDPTRFCIIIPAHDEQAVIAQTINSLNSLSYPAHKIKCLVIADNCSDNTASIVREIPTLFDLMVLERNDPQNIGKGYALNFALGTISNNSDIDAIVIVDADTHVDVNFLACMDNAFKASQNPSETFAAQGFYQVLNVSDNWRTALMAGALSLVHYVRPLARERWACSVGLKGNGMCFGFGLAKAIPWRVDSITEDIDYTLDALQKKGVRIQFVPDAVVRAEMPVTADAAQGQRRRWEKGRAGIVKRRALPLLVQGIARFDKKAIDIALDLMCPPLAQLALGVVLLCFVSLLIAVVHAPLAGICGALSAFCVLGIITYVLVGFRIAKAPPEAYQALKMAVFYVPWKIKSLAMSKSSGHWNKTQRNGHSNGIPIPIDTISDSTINGFHSSQPGSAQEVAAKMADQGVNTK